jgi:hypothetical protein
LCNNIVPKEWHVVIVLHGKVCIWYDYVRGEASVRTYR